MQHAAPQPANSLLGRLSVDGTPNGTMRPNQRALWDFGFIDGRTGSSISRFDIYHDKAMHLIMVHRDLASFAHLHPSLEADGRFRLPINAPNDDPDNRDAVSAVSRPGTYFLFGEVVPNGQSTTLARFTVQVQGTEQLEPLTVDPVSSSGEIQRYASPDRPAGQAGDPYQVTLRMARGEHHAGMPMVTFNFTVRERGPQGRYAEVRNLETWLGMPGHAVLIGRQGERVEDRVFRHLHAASHEAGAQGRHTMQANGPQCKPTARNCPLWRWERTCRQQAFIASGVSSSTAAAW